MLSVVKQIESTWENPTKLLYLKIIRHQARSVPKFQSSKTIIFQLRGSLFTGMLDCVGRTWILYAGNPKADEPIVVESLQSKSPC
jgi:hypothetical protein